MFTQDDALWLSEAVGGLYAAQSLAEFSRAAVDAVHRRLGSMTTACEEIGRGFSSYALHQLRTSIPVPQDHAAFLHDNPFGALLTISSPPSILHMHAHVAKASWEQTDHYNGIARPMGWDDQLAMIMHGSSGIFVVGMYRDSIYSPAEYALMRLLQPHLAASWQRAKGWESDEFRRATLQIELSPSLHPRRLSSVQHAALKCYYPGWTAADTLPPELHAWVSHTLQALRSSPPAPLRAHIVESARGQLLIRCFPATANTPAFLFMVEKPATPDFFRLHKFGFTSRECEALHWIARGKRDSEIAMIMGCAVGTVRKHVEHLLAKLHVETRSAAARQAGELLAGG